MINYKLLNDSIEYFEQQGFQRIESPWTVSEYIENITKPIERQSMQLKHNDKCLVGSGEQSFLYLYLKGFLPLGCYQTITPCYRYEAFDDLHSKYFIKNELIKTDVVNDQELIKVVQTAFGFFSKYLDCEIIQTTDGWDISYNNIELGSYGIRKCDFLTWIYATGCAEPRLSTVMNKYGIS